jgi:hypothetical protein
MVLVLMTDGVADDLEPAQLADFFDALYQDLKHSESPQRQALAAV